MNEYFSVNSSSPQPKPDRAGRKAKGKAAIWITNNIAGLSSIVLLAFVTYLLFIASFDLDGTEIVRQAFTVIGVITAVATLILYSNGYSVGSEATDRLNNIAEIFKSYKENVKKIIVDNKTDSLDDFIEYYKQAELSDTRKALLAQVNLTYKDYGEILENKYTKKLTKKQLKMVEKVTDIKAIDLNRNMILSSDGTARRRNPITSVSTIETYKWVRISLKVIRLLVFSSFALSVGIHIYYNLSAETVLSAILQSAVMVGSFVSGFITGKNVKIKYAQRADDINLFLDEFFVWEKK